jgi:hypothetical protein
MDSRGGSPWEEEQDFGAPERCERKGVEDHLECATCPAAPFPAEPGSCLPSAAGRTLPIRNAPANPINAAYPNPTPAPNVVHSRPYPTARNRERENRSHNAPMGYDAAVWLFGPNHPWFYPSKPLENTTYML